MIRNLFLTLTIGAVMLYAGCAATTSTTSSGGSSGGGGDTCTSIAPTTGMNASLVVGQADFTSTVNADTTKSVDYPSGITIGGGKLIVTARSQNRVMIWNTLPTANNQAASVVVGQPDFNDTTGRTTASGLQTPYGVYSDGTKLFIADKSNNRVMIFNTIPTSNGASADVAVGQPDKVTSTSGTTASTFNGCRSVYVSGGKLLIADTGNNRVLIYNSVPTSDGASANLVLGQTNFTNSGSGTTSTTLSSPSYSWTNGTKVIVADSGNQRILIWNTFPTSDGQAADVVIGQTDFVTATSGLSASKFNMSSSYSSSLAVDCSGRLYVGDSNNHRVLVFNSIPTSNGASADIVLGQSNFTSNSSATTQSGFNYTNAMYFDANGRIWINDITNDRVLRFGD